MTTKKDASKPRRKASIEPDSWEWETIDGVKVLTFYLKNKKLLSLPINESVSENTALLASELYEASYNITNSESIEELDNYIIRDDKMADAWTYRIPAIDGLPNNLVLMKNGETLGILPINLTVGQKLLLKLNHFKPVYYGKKASLEWFKKHKIVSVILIAFFGYGLFLIILDAIRMLIPAS